MGNAVLVKTAVNAVSIPKSRRMSTIWQVHASPRRFRVNGAGCAAANGVYVEKGLHEGLPFFDREKGHLRMQFHFFESDFQSCDRWHWEIKNVRTNIILYYAGYGFRNVVTDGISGSPYLEDKLPPPQGWENDMHAGGEGPAPTVEEVVGASEPDARTGQRVWSKHMAQYEEPSAKGKSINVESEDSETVSPKAGTAELGIQLRTSTGVPAAAVK
jgi:hypothetical protein